MFILYSHTQTRESHWLSLNIFRLNLVCVLLSLPSFFSSSPAFYYSCGWLLWYHRLNLLVVWNHSRMHCAHNWFRKPLNENQVKSITWCFSCESLYHAPSWLAVVDIWGEWDYYFCFPPFFVCVRRLCLLPSCNMNHRLLGNDSFINEVAHKYLKKKLLSQEMWK